MSYNIIQYGKMINDHIRVNSYAKCLKKSINNKSIVLDIGTGTGIFALLAARLGARKVYAVETSPVIDIARDNAVKNNLTDKIEFIHNSAGDIALPEKVDIIVCDLRGSLPFHKNNMRVIIDVRDKYLKVNGLIIPSTDRIYVALVQNRHVYRDYQNPWLNNEYDLDMSSASKYATNTITKSTFKPRQLLTAKIKLTDINYSQINNESIDTEIICRCNKNGTTHGFILWFDAELLKGIKYSNAPGEKNLIYGGQMFYPFTTPVNLKIGDIIKLHISARNIHGEYVWSWNTQFLDKSKKHEMAKYSQSSFYSTPITKRTLMKISRSYIPKLDRKGRLALETLNLFGGKNIEQIAGIVYKKNPGYFNSIDDTLEFVRDISIKYSAN